MTEQVIEDIRATLIGTVRQLRSFDRIRTISGSPADQDAETGGTTPGGAPWSQQVQALALMRLAAAEDGLGAAATLLWHEYGCFSPWVLARFVLENAGLAWWLLEPSMPAWDRISRALTDRVRDLQEDRKLARDIDAFLRTTQATLDDSSEWLARVDRHLAHIGEQARSLGLPTHDHPKHGLWAIGDQHRPNRIDLATSLLGPGLGSSFYRTMTAMSHGGHTVLGQLYDVVDHEATAPGCVVAQQRVSLQDIAVLAQALLTVAFKAGDRAVDYFGWNTSSWHQWKAQVLPAAKSWLTG